MHGGVGSSAGPWPRRAWYLASLAERSLPCHSPHNPSFKCTQPVAFALSGKQVVSSKSTVVIRDKHPKLQLTHPSVMDCAAYLAIIFYHVVIFCAVLCMLGTVYSSWMPVFQGRLTPEWWKWERQVIHFSKLAVPPHFRQLGTIMSCIAPQPCYIEDWLKAGNEPWRKWHRTIYPYSAAASRTSCWCTVNISPQPYV